MRLPCETCKFRTEREVGFRVFIGCNDSNKKKENFHNDTYFYRHSCTAYEEGDMMQEREIIKVDWW